MENVSFVFCLFGASRLVNKTIVRSDENLFILRLLNTEKKTKTENTDTETRICNALSHTYQRNLYETW